MTDLVQLGNSPKEGCWVEFELWFRMRGGRGPVSERAGCGASCLIALEARMDRSPDEGAVGLSTLIFASMQNLEGKVRNVPFFYVATGTPESVMTTLEAWSAAASAMPISSACEGRGKWWPELQCSGGDRDRIPTPMVRAGGIHIEDTGSVTILPGQGLWPREAAAVMFIPGHLGKRADAQSKALNITHAEEVAIALAACHLTSQAITSDSRGACRNIENGCVAYLAYLNIPTIRGTPQPAV